MSLESTTAKTENVTMDNGVLSQENGHNENVTGKQENLNQEGLDEGVAQKVDDKFVYMDDVKAILNISMKTEKNVILYGKGGYGKSEYALEYLLENGINPYVITMGTGMTTDRMFGGLDIPTFNSTGKIEYLVENSFMNADFVIFEELFDAPDFILEQLKDILSSGVFRNGTQIFPIKTRTIICCTNKTREEFSKNNSLKALMERFPLEVKVEWKDHNRLTYEKLLNARMGFADPMLTYILEQFAVAGNTISPRIAINAAELVAHCGPDSLKFLADFAAKPDILKQSILKFSSIKEINEKIKIMNDIINEYNKCQADELDGLKEATALNNKLYSEITKLKAIKADDSMVGMSTNAIKQFSAIYNKNKKELEIIMNIDNISKSMDTAMETLIS
jgi:MoxR-like ATPase